MAIDPKKFRNAKAADYSSLSGTKKKGAKLQVKPKTKLAEPKSNVKVIGKNDSSLKQRYPQTLTTSRAKASWEKDAAPAKKQKFMDKLKGRKNGGAAGMAAKKK